MPILNVDKDNFQKAIAEADGTILLDFWAPWCGPCRAIAPILEQIAEERSDVTVCKINVDEQTDLAKQFGIKGIPTLVVMKQGAILTRATGVKQKDSILAMLDTD